MFGQMMHSVAVSVAAKQREKELLAGQKSMSIYEAKSRFSPGMAEPGSSPGSLSTEKRAMNSESTGIGLSADQARELHAFRNQYQTSIAQNLSGQALQFGNQLGNYLSALAIHAVIGDDAPQTANVIHLRRLALRAFHGYLRRKPTAEDLLQELTRVVAVPTYIADAIRRDVERLQR
jgi:hypothetical protein